MELEMEYIYRVYKEGSISKAAEKLFMTQPALSIAIRRVETKLNAAIFDRSQHPLKLTPVGEIYIEKYQQIRMLEKELANQISDVHELQQGELVVGGTHFILSYVLSPVLARFSELYPNIEIRLFECGSSQLESLLVSGTIDICLKCDECHAGARPIDFAFRDHLLIAVPEAFVSQYNLPKNGMTLDMVKRDEHLISTDAYIHQSDIADVPFLVLTSGNNLRVRFFELFKQSSVEPIVKMQIEQIVTAYHLADQGMGATLTSALIVKNSVCENMVYYQLASPLMIRDFYMIGRQKSYVSNTCEAFIKMVQAYFEATEVTPTKLTDLPI